MPRDSGFPKKLIAIRLSYVALDDCRILQGLWGVSRTSAVERALALARIQSGPRHLRADSPTPESGSYIREMRRTRRTDSGPLGP